MLLLFILFIIIYMYAYLRCYLETYDRTLQYERPSIGYYIANMYVCWITCVVNSDVSLGWSLYNLTILPYLVSQLLLSCSYKPVTSVQIFRYLVVCLFFLRPILREIGQILPQASIRNNAVSAQTQVLDLNRILFS